MNQLEKDKEFLRHQVRVLAEDNGKLWGSWRERKDSLKVYRQAHLDITGCSEKEVDSVIEGVLAEYSCKIQKQLTIKKPY